MIFVAARFAVLRSVVKVQKKQFRQTALLQQKDDLKQVILTEKELYKDGKGIEWKENNKEIVMNGKYHEVVSVERKDNVYIVNIIEDSKENELFGNFFEKTDKKGQLADCIMLVLGMNFMNAEPFEFKQQTAILIDHQTRFSLKNGIEFYSRTVKPPRA